MTYEEKFDAVQAFCDKHPLLIDEAPEGSDLWAFKGLDDAMTDIEAVLCDDGEMLLPSNVDGLNRAKTKIINAMLHIAERWSNETDKQEIEAKPVRHAHWVFRDEDKHLLEDGCIPSNMWCSYCNQWSDNDSYGDAYCHNCGARMDEPDLADEIAKKTE